ncbi:SpoIIE family protein phosphatase [Shewanella sp. JM162201]|uniref:SpoIIE family protein phosphatase n=1 Tax=Shewanella jiangmenensis TaxID=2837387 RepID=A0ABS5V044_9GAMM|nr:SpoIIE family protein phosphatase [Shewanella jiangmenensis]MBT1442981.1 SpoIIE family protein phosphatase [Shewanella jiangmenensis]
MGIKPVTTDSQALKVLLVEDTASERLYISELLHQQGFEVHECASAEAALDWLDEHQVDMLVSDWRMPGMSGPQLCQIVKSRPSPPYVLMLTANADTGFLIQGIESGADDYLPKPFVPAVLKVRLLAAVRLIRLNQRLARQNHSLEQALTESSELNQRLATDLQQAALLQQSLLPAPSSDFDNWHCVSRFASANVLAGDVFHVFSISADELGFYLIDVAGHGAAAAMQAFSLAMTLSPCRCDWQRVSPANLLGHLNAQYRDPSHQGQFATALIGRLNLKSGECCLSSAGHPLPLRLDVEGCCHTIADNQCTGLPLGIDPKAHYLETRFHFSAGERMLLFSDGAYESQHPVHGSFGLSRLKQLALAAKPLKPDALIQHLFHAIHLWQGGSFQDDVSLILLCAPDCLTPSGRSHEQSAA